MSQKQAEDEETSQIQVLHCDTLIQCFVRVDNISFRVPHNFVVSDTTSAGAKQSLRIGRDIEIREREACGKERGDLFCFDTDYTSLLAM